MSDVLAILCADLHLSLTPPVARSAEPDWLEAQARPLRELKQLWDRHHCPILVAGDVFDRWNAQPELINWAIREMPAVYAVPGQHDLPLHSLKDIKRSAYWTLVEAGTITDLCGGDGGLIVANGAALRVNAFPWGLEPCELEGREDYPEDEDIYVALIHRYVWQQGAQHPGAAQETHVTGLLVNGYDLAVVGDNHQHFNSLAGRCLVWNCGCMIPRKQDERKCVPLVGLLTREAGGSFRVEPYFLSIDEDRWLDAEGQAAVAETLDLSQFLEDLRGLSAVEVDFREAVHRCLDDSGASPEVRRAVLKLMEGD